MKWRWVLVVIWLAMHAAAFNGHWRIGADSATFRSVAHSLATTGEYAILGLPQKQVYPGLPLLLAGLERLFGPAAWPGILVMLAMSAATLYFTYRLMRRVVQPWAATVVTAGVAFNHVFVQHGHELMTDMPFLLGVVMALWGWESLTDPGWGRRLRSALWLALGLGLAASMRPTFWVLAAAFALVCAGGLLVGLLPRLAPTAWTSGPDRARSWRFYAVCLAAVGVVGLMFLIFDPRTRSLDLLGGGYEAEVAERAMNLGERLRETPTKLWEMFEDHLEAFFFAERVEGLNLLLAAALLAGVVLVARRRPLWGLLVAVLCATLYVASTTPRYYLMVVPILWLGWLWLTMAVVGRLFRSLPARSFSVGLVLTLTVLCNTSHDFKLILEQRSDDFIAAYQRGLYEPVVAMAGVLKQNVDEQETVIGPYAPEMTYLSGRRVLGRRFLFSGDEHTLAQQAAVVRESGAAWAVFPTNTYEKKDVQLYRLGRAGIFVPKNEDDSTVIKAGTFDGIEWYLTRDWAIDDTMIPPDKPARR